MFGLEQKRESLIANLKTEGYIKTKRVEYALRKIPRENFIPAEMRDSAYSDHPLPIGYGQTISAPHMVAIMTELLEPKKTDKALEIGTGSGYQSAVLSVLVRKVYSIEVFPELTEFAKSNLKKTGIRNVEVVSGDGSKGLPSKAPFDKIIVTCAIPKVIFNSLVSQLKEGGIIVAPVGEPYGIQTLTAGKKIRGKLKTKEYFGCVFVPLRSTR
ncbi:MAG: protein-L-isoaspartate(D-aspartate) O-methyltransferase [Candidatus Aenigmatarchaeota archaeon]